MNILKKTYKYGFTLVELLVVITVIAILASVSFKAASVMTQKTAIARTSERLAVIAACLAEYYAEFGQYPGAVRVDYTDWSEGNKPPPDEWKAKVAEKRAGDGPNFAKMLENNIGLLYFFRHKMDGQKWDEFKDEVGLHSWAVGGSEFISGDVPYTNMFYNLLDGWDGGFNYRCEEPYTSYELYSNGSSPSTHADDIHAGQKY